MSWKSYAEWPREVYSAGVSSDTHDTKEQALAVCGLLHLNGFGGNRVHFPLRTWVEEVASDPSNLADFEGMTPGPWTVENGEAIKVRSEEDSPVCMISFVRGRHGLLGRIPTEEGEANARAIAAVPDLIAELRKASEENKRLERQAEEDADRHCRETIQIGEERNALRADIERLTRDLSSICELFTDSTPDNIRMVVGAYVRTIQGVKDRLLAENESARARIATLEAQVEEMGRDKARLDWLNSNYHFKAHSDSRGVTLEVHGESFYENTLAQAIDAANAGGEQG